MTSAALRQWEWNGFTRLDRNTGRANQGMAIMGNAMRAGANNIWTPTTVVQKYFREDEAREQFSALVVTFTPRQLSRASGCTTEGVKHWIDGSRCPNLASAVNVARALPSVRQWLMTALGEGDRAAQAQSVDAVLRALYGIVAGTGDEAAAARQIIAKINRPDPAPEPQPERDTNTIDLFARRRP